MPFLDDGQVCTKVGVINFIKAHPAQGGKHLAGHPGADRQAKFFTKSCPDGGRNLDNNMLIRI